MGRDQAMPEDGDPVKFYHAIIDDRRGLADSEGVVVKYKVLFRFLC